MTGCPHVDTVQTWRMLDRTRAHLLVRCCSCDAIVREHLAQLLDPAAAALRARIERTP